MPDAIVVKGLSYAYPEEKTPALEDVNLAVKAGSVTGIIGPSGCGKSTLMLALAGLIPHSLPGTLKGTVTIEGIDTRGSSMAELSQRVQILFQNPESQLFALNVEDEITFGPENLALPWAEIAKRRDAILHGLGIEHLRHRSIEELSSGQKQKVALASILSMQPSVLLFDEPTANLDGPATELLEKLIAKLKRKHTIVIVEHNLDFVMSACDKVFLMDKGKLKAQGTAQALMRKKEFLSVMRKPYPRKKVTGKLQKLPQKTQNPVLLRIEKLDFSYQHKILHAVDLEIGRGDFLGILGLNGSGKSTLALNIIGLRKGKGRIVFDGEDLAGKDVYERTRRIGFVFQNPDYQLFEDTLEKEIAFGPRNLGCSEKDISRRIKEALEVTGLSHLKKRDPHALSVGQKRRVSIASVLAMKPEMLIIDEPDTGLDALSARAVMDHVRRLNAQGMTVVMISHNLELLSAYCTRLIGVHEGRIVDPCDILKKY